MAIDVRPLKPTSNEIVLNRIRNEGTSDYQRRIPAATKGSVQDTLKRLQEYRPAWNEFVDSLINRIGLVVARNNSWTNPLSEFKSGMLTYGDTIEEIQVGLIKARSYDHDRDDLERELFGMERPDVAANFHKVNREDRYKISINEPELQRAFLEPNGLTSFISQLMEAPATSDNWDEFLLMCQLFPEYESNGGFFKVGVPDVSALSSTEADSKAMLRRLRSVADKLPFISTHYNAAGMPVAAKKEDLILFTTPDAKAAMDVEALAAAFNLSLADAYGRMITIPEEQFGIDGAQAIMTTKDFFVVADQLFQTEQMYNPAGLHRNYWLHHWQVISASRFVPAILFTSKGGDEIIKVVTPVTSVTAITVYDKDGATVATDVVRGEIYALDASAVTTPADGVNDGVRWELTGNTSNRTYVTRTGVLHVAGNEGGATLTVKAVATWTNPEGLMVDGKSATKTLNVTGDAIVPWPVAGSTSETVTGITVAGVAVSPAFAAGTFAYTVDVPGSTADASRRGRRGYHGERGGQRHYRVRAVRPR